MAEVWNFFDPASKSTVLRVLRQEIESTFELASDPAVWESPTACELWQVRDVIGHLVDTAEGYLPGFDIARNGGTAADPHGLVPMAQLADESARAFRKVPQTEMLERLRDVVDRILGVFEGLSDDDWSTLMVPHPFMGPLPAMFYPEFQLVDFAVHGWDIRQGIGQPHGLDGDSADLLAPLIPVLLGATADASSVAEPYSVGIRTSGRNGGDTRADVTTDGVQFAPGNIEDCAAILEFDPASLVLTGFGRMNAGTVRGDREKASQFRSLFFAI